MDTVSGTEIGYITFDKIIKPMFREAIPEMELRIDAQTFVILTAFLDHDYECSWLLQVRSKDEFGNETTCDALACYESTVAQVQGRRQPKVQVEWWNKAAEAHAWYEAGGYDESLVWFVGWDIAMRENMRDNRKA